MGSFARLFTVGAVTALSASALVVSPATADTSPAPAPPATNRASSAPETRGDARTTGLRIKIKGVSAGARASVTVTGPKQRTKGKQYSKVIHRSKTLKVRPGKYKITSGILGATGGIDVPKKATKKVRVRKNKIKTRTMRYVFYAATPVKPATCAEGGTCVVGDTGTGGGTVFYVDEGAAAGSRYMEAAPNTWNGGSSDLAIAWCSNTTTLIAGTFGTAIGTGKTNTDNMVAACTSGAANSVRGYSSPGAPAGSWSLPSKDENNQLFIQRATVGGFAGGLGLAEYWSSSQIDNVSAWGQSFTIGLALTLNKDTATRVRPVRAF